jgi:hypothetical protein
VPGCRYATCPPINSKLGDIVRLKPAISVNVLGSIYEVTKRFFVVGANESGSVFWLTHRIFDFPETFTDREVATGSGEKAVAVGDRLLDPHERVARESELTKA